MAAGNDGLSVMAHALQAGGRAGFAADIAGFPYRLSTAPAGSIGINDETLVALLGSNAGWLRDEEIQDRLHAILLYQAAMLRPTRIHAQNGRLVTVHNPLFAATLRADADGAGVKVSQLLANSARRQDNYLALRLDIPEWCEKRIYVLSDAASRGILWLPRNARQKHRRIAAIRATSRGR